MMEGISVSTKRQLALQHPIMKLLNPHFLYLMAIDRYTCSSKYIHEVIIKYLYKIDCSKVNLYKNPMWTFTVHVKTRHEELLTKK